MKRETRQTLEALNTQALTFYEQVDAIVRLFATDDVGEIIAALPAELRHELVDLGERAYAPEGPRLVVSGTPVPEASLRAFRAWLRSQVPAEARKHTMSGWDGWMMTAAAQLTAQAESSSVRPSFIPRAPTDLRTVETASEFGGAPRQPQR